MKPAKQSIPPLMSVNIEAPFSIHSNKDEPKMKPKNGQVNGNLNCRKLCNFKITFPDKITLERNINSTKSHMNNLSNLFSKYDQERPLKAIKRKNLFGSKLDDNSLSDISTYYKEIKNCADLSEKFKKFDENVKIDEKKHHQNVAWGIEYLAKFNRHSITSSLVEKIDNKFKQIAFSDDLIRHPASLSDTFALSFKHNSKLVFHRSKNYHLNNLFKNKSDKINLNNVNSLNLFEDNSEIVNSILPELNNLMNKNTRLDECQNFFDSVNMEKILNSNETQTKKTDIQTEKVCSLIETDVRYHHYILKMVNILLDSLQKIYNLNLQQIKYLITIYQKRLMAKNLTQKIQLFLNEQCIALNKKLYILIEDYAKLNFDSICLKPSMLNIGSIIYNYLLGQLNQHLSKSESKNSNYIRDLIDYYEIIKIEYEKFCIFDLNFQLGLSITDNQASSLMTYLDDFKILLGDVLAEFLLAGKLEPGIQSKIKDILQMQIVLIGDISIQGESLTDPRNHNLEICTEFKKLKFEPVNKSVSIPSFNQKLNKKLKYKFKADLDMFDVRKWSSVSEPLQSHEVVCFEDATELSFNEHEMNQLLGSNMIENDVQMEPTDSLSSGDCMPKNDNFSSNLSLFGDGLSFIEPSIHNFEDIQNFPMTQTIADSNIESLIRKDLSEELDNNRMLNDNSDNELINEISQFVIKPLIDHIEQMLVSKSNF